eukprot:gene6772-19_t
MSAADLRRVMSMERVPADERAEADAAAAAAADLRRVMSMDTGTRTLAGMQQSRPSASHTASLSYRGRGGITAATPPPGCAGLREPYGTAPALDGSVAALASHIGGFSRGGAARRREQYADDSSHRIQKASARFAGARVKLLANMAAAKASDGDVGEQSLLADDIGEQLLSELSRGKRSRVLESAQDQLREPTDATA